MILQATARPMRIPEAQTPIDFLQDVWTFSMELPSWCRITAFLMVYRTFQWTLLHLAMNLSESSIDDPLAFHLLDVVSKLVAIPPRNLLCEAAKPWWSHADFTPLEPWKCLKGKDQKDTVTRCQWMKVLQRIRVCPKRCNFRLKGRRWEVG